MFEKWMNDTEKLYDRLVEWIPNLFFGIMVFLIFWLLAGRFRAVIIRICQNRSLDEDLTNFFAETVKTILIIVGIVCGLGTMNVDVTALVAGLGLTGFALGFALKDLISNLLAGVLLLLYRPFQRGDHIDVGGFSGFVREIDLRYTTLEEEEKIYLVPNSLLLSKGIKVERLAEPD